MNLKKKKALAAKTLGVGLAKIIFNTERLDEIKEAITKQDIRDLFESGAILVRESRGRKILEKKGRRRAGSIRMKIKPGKREYMTLTRKFRAHISQLRKHGTIDKEKWLKIRKEIRARAFKNMVQLRERLEAK